MVASIKVTTSGQFTLNLINQSTIILFVNNEDYTKSPINIKSEKIPYHTYTVKNDKFLAFVQRGLTTGTKIEDDLQLNYKILARDTYRMTTKNIYLIKIAIKYSSDLKIIKKFCFMFLNQLWFFFLQLSTTVLSKYSTIKMRKFQILLYDSCQVVFKKNYFCNLLINEVTLNIVQKIF